MLDEPGLDQDCQPVLEAADYVSQSATGDTWHLFGFSGKQAQRVRWRGIGFVLGLLLPVVLFAGVAMCLSSDTSPQFSASQAGEGFAVKYEVSATNGAFCGRIEDNVEYVGKPFANLPNITTADLCCIKCQENPQCRVWMWGKKRGILQSTEGGDHVCTLRTVDREVRSVNRLPKKGVVSGLPFNWDAPASLFCFALMQPMGYERTLVEMQYKQRWGIFGCNEYQVISNASVQLAPGLVTSVIASDLICEMGGEFNTALNTDIFLLVWQKVFDETRFQYSDWTVKVDPDCVFFPYRLRIAVSFHADSHGGAYLNNCKYGLHGPLEVLSARAVVAYVAGQMRCKAHFNEVCSGPCGWGEDMFMDQCLDKVLGIERIDDWNLLSEAHCDSDDWMECKSRRIAYHPFKSTVDYQRCMGNADYGALPNLTQPLHVNV